MHPFATVRAQDRLQAAADAVERESSVEFVVAVRPRSIDLIGADLIGGAVLGYAVLLFTLFAPPEFSLVGIASASVGMFAAGVLGVRAVPGLRRALTGSKRMRDGVLRGARAAFVELGVHSTRGRTGVLVYASLAEARVGVVGDQGVLHAMPQALDLLARHAEAAAAEHGLDASAVLQLAAAIEAFGASAKHSLPRAHDDIDELGELR